jgi:hypothetical protein
MGIYKNTAKHTANSPLNPNFSTLEPTLTAIAGLELFAPVVEFVVVAVEAAALLLDVEVDIAPFEEPEPALELEDEVPEFVPDVDVLFAPETPPITEPPGRLTVAFAARA